MDVTLLSEHFSLEELTRSDTAIRLGIDNTPKQEYIDNLVLLCQHVLEPVRVHFGPVRINSGYRSLSLNMCVNPMTSTVNKVSQHCYGRAADFEIPGTSNFAVATWCCEHLPVYDQIILEFYTPGVPSSGWIHISYNQQNQRRQVMTAVREQGKLIYKNGLIA